MIRKLEIILKTVERCNIACDYCYFFFASDDSYKNHAIYISRETIEKTSQYLKNAVKFHEYNQLQIDFHGGEPLMQNKNDFEWMCEHFLKELSTVVDLKFALQTNGMLIDEQWITLFAKYNVGVGVSLDGPEHINDIHRRDKRGKGTYAKTSLGWHKLINCYENGLINSRPGILCVVNPHYNAKEIYRHFVDTLGAKQMNFLLPDLNHQTFPSHCLQYHCSEEDYAVFLCDLLDEWLKDKNFDINVLILQATLKMFLGGTSNLINFGKQGNLVDAITISSSGNISPDDTLKSTTQEIATTNLTVFNSSFDNYIKDAKIIKISQALAILPGTCNRCIWKNICCGGSAVERFSADNFFDNPSVYCNGLKKFFNYAAERFIQNGVKFETVKKAITGG